MDTCRTCSPRAAAAWCIRRACTYWRFFPRSCSPYSAAWLYIADEVFFTGTAAEVSPIRSIDRVVIGDGKPGEITKSIADEFFWGIANGLKPDRFGWLTPVKVNATEPVGVSRAQQSKPRAASFRLPCFF